MHCLETDPDQRLTNIMTDPFIIDQLFDEDSLRVVKPNLSHQKYLKLRARIVESNNSNSNNQYQYQQQQQYYPSSATTGVVVGGGVLNSNTNNATINGNNNNIPSSATLSVNPSPLNGFGKSATSFSSSFNNNPSSPNNNFENNNNGTSSIGQPDTEVRDLLLCSAAAAVREILEVLDQNL